MYDVYYSDLKSHCLALDSAVVAFWKLFEPADASRSLAPSPRRAKVHDLPAEVLLIIFRLVYAHKVFDRIAGWIPAVSVYTDINCPTLFPYAIAAVCPRWRDIMSLAPEFWKRVVIAVDIDPTTPPALAAVLSWSRNLPLEVIVTRVTFDRAVDVQHERDQVMSVVKILVHSHANRSQKIHFDLMFSSSLPSFPDSFQGTWSNLRELYLQCQEDNGGSNENREPITSAVHQYPILQRLFLDGRNYYKAFRTDSQWMVRCPSVNQLAISHYTPLSGESFPLTDLVLPLVALPSLGMLRINNIFLHPSPSTITTLPLRDEGSIHFSHMHDFKPIADILDLLPSDFDIILTRCTIGHPKGPFHEEGKLTLQDIDGDLVPLLRWWDGEDLVVHNCPGFNDVVLDLMATVEARRRYSCAPRMGYLAISNCPNFTAAALGRLVSARSEVHQGATYPGICDISVCGPAPDISIEDQKLISRYLYEFKYYPSPS